MSTDTKGHDSCCVSTGASGVQAPSACRAFTSCTSGESKWSQPPRYSALLPQGEVYVYCPMCTALCALPYMYCRICTALCLHTRHLRNVNQCRIEWGV